MIQTDACALCLGGIYRDIHATWDDDPWLHMHPELIVTPHVPQPRTRSIYDDDTTERQ